MGKPYQRCSISVMDSIADSNITFDEKGICNYYYDYIKAEQEHVIKGEEGKNKLDELVNKIQKEGNQKPYDCITGISGGVDSTYVTYLAKEFGLRPLVVHFDNGWNSELAVKNIENTVNKLGFDLFTYVVNWDEFRDLQMAYLKASVIDIEVPTDHAIAGTLFRLAKKHNIKYCLSGNNIVTEQVLPKSWYYNKNDHVNLLDIHKNFGTLPLKTFPIYNSYQKKIDQYIIKTETFKPLNYLDFNYERVKEIITKELDWKDYGGKHYESIFTRFYQGYILPKKFGIDKRKAHLSNLIFSRQISREEAIEKLKEPIYPASLFKIDYDFFLKKFGITSDQFDKIMQQPIRNHKDFKIELPLKKRLISFWK